MIYPGNTSLSSAVKDRVVSTFQQALTLYKQGRMEEVAAGCTLILQMDPTFDPARKLVEKLRNPSSPIDVDKLLPRDARAPMDQAREAMVARDFQRVIHLTSEILTDDMLNDDARVLGDEARDKLEAAPFVDQFTRRAEQSLAAGNAAAAKMELEKARALDPTHPEVVRVGQALATQSAAPKAPAASPSFVVDDARSQPATGRGTAQAADFGFTFEEDKPAASPAAAAPVSFENFSFDSPAQPVQDFSNFSFETPSAPAAPAAPEPSLTSFSFDTPSTPPQPAPPAPGAAEFDFATASIVTSPDEQKKIEQYLSDGDRAFNGGDYQQAIDLWSRIFLIDVTNDAASERIERAKAKRREIEQKAESILAAGIQAFDRGDTAKAHAQLTEALTLDPGNTTAQDYLNRLGETVAEAPPARPAFDDSNEKLDMAFFDDEPLPSSFEAPLMPPEPGRPAPVTDSGKRAAAPATAAPAKTARKLPMGLLAAILGAVVLIGGGWFVWSRFMTEPAVDAETTQATLDRATALANAGKYDQAMALLQDIKPGDPQHDRALVMIADLQQKRAGAAALIDGVPAEQYYAQRLDAARAALALHDFSGAKTAFEQAMRVKALPPDLKPQYDAAAQQVSKLDAAKALFAERKYSEAIANLQPLLDQDPQNQNIQRLIVDARFNIAATALQEERTADAMREFDEVLKLNPNDELAKRSRDLAARYDKEPKDLLYRIYVKYLPLRQAT